MLLGRRTGNWLGWAACLGALWFATADSALGNENPAIAAGETPASGSAGSGKSDESEPPKFPEWDKVLKGTTKVEGLFPLHYNAKEQKLFLEISSGQFDKDLICPISISRGAGGLFLGGDTLNFGDQWVLSFRRAGDRILVVRRNIYFKAKDGTPQADAVKVSYNDSIILALPIRSEQGGGSKVLVDGADLFMTDLANIGIRPDQARSTWGKIKGFEHNIGVEVNAVFPLGFGGYYFFFFGGPEVPDYRGVQVTIHYGLSMVPSSSYTPRAADDRVGHFLSVLKDYSTDKEKSPIVRYVTRWKLEKADPSSDKSPPKEPIIFWIEKTVPREYRPYVKDGILEWNKAFEQIGFIDAIQVRDQQPQDDFDPEDIRYNTFRWITTSTPFAMGPSRTNPLTGQILDADILFDEAMVRYWRQDFLLTTGLPQSLELLHSGQRQAWFKLFSSSLPMLHEVEPALMRMLDEASHDEHAPHSSRAMAQAGTGKAAGAHRMAGHFSGRSCCLRGHSMAQQLGTMAAVMAAQGIIPAGGKVPEEFIGQAIKEVTMHEVGHTLGLRHNFKASIMLSLAETHNKEITSKRGIAGSVMDYLPANIARKGQTQGHYFSPTIGPYDYWAIEYAYKPISGDEAAELAKIGSRVAEPDLAFGTDEDVWGNPDPRINLYDLGDPLDYAKERILLVQESLQTLTEKMVADGEGWQRTRDAFRALLGELSSATFLATQYVGGEHTHRDHKADPNGRLPYEPIPIAKQRDAIAFLSENILTDKAFKFPPELLRKLAPEFWSDWLFSSYNMSAEAFPVNDYVLSIQSEVLYTFLAGDTLSRLQDIELHATPEQEVLRMPEVFDSLSTAIWSELPGDPAAAPAGKLAVSEIRRRLQRAHFSRLAEMVLGTSYNPYGYSFSFYGGESVPADARSLARLQLKKLQARIEGSLGNAALEKDSYTEAHLSELKDRIDKVLDADMQINRT